MKNHSVLIDYIEKNFVDGNITVQIKNLRKFVKHINNEGISLDISLEDAKILLDGSKKLNNLMSAILNQSDYSMFLEDENVFTIATVYAKEHKIELDSSEEEKPEYLGNEDNLKYYFNDIKDKKLLTREEEQDLIIRAQNGDESAVNKLIESNLKLVVSIAKRYIGKGYEFQDLIQEGNLGLYKAIEKFDINMGYKFSTYATWWVRQSISRSIADKGRTIRIPVHLYETVSKINRYIKKVEAENGYTPTKEEISEVLDIKLHTVETALSVQNTLSLNQTYITAEGDEDNSLQDIVADEYNLEDEVIDNMYLGQFYAAFKTTDVINDKERLVLEYRNGFIDGKAWTLEEIAKLFGLTRERIRQIEARALRKLGKNPRFKEYVDRIHYKEDAYVYENTYKSLKRRYLEK